MRNCKHISLVRMYMYCLLKKSKELSTTSEMTSKCPKQNIFDAHFLSIKLIREQSSRRQPSPTATMAFVLKPIQRPCKTFFKFKVQ